MIFVLYNAAGVQIRQPETAQAGGGSAAGEDNERAGNAAGGAGRTCGGGVTSPALWRGADGTLWAD